MPAVVKEIDDPKSKLSRLSDSEKLLWGFAVVAAAAVALEIASNPSTNEESAGPSWQNANMDERRQLMERQRQSRDAEEERRRIYEQGNIPIEQKDACEEAYYRVHPISRLVCS